jgi:hypothetical protein
MRLFIKRLERDEGEIHRIEWEVQDFLKEVEVTTEELRKKYRGAQE